MPLVVDAIPGQRLRWRLSGKLAEPVNPRWKTATAAQRAAYWPILADRLLFEWRQQMLAGRGRRGRVRRAKAISRVNYQLDGKQAGGPGLLPQWEQSRAYRYARVTPYADLGRVTGYWSSGFGRILSYHHTGTAGRGFPIIADDGRIRWVGLRGQVTGIVRDLMPTETAITLAVASATQQWLALIGPEPVRQPEPTPTPTPEPAATEPTPRRRGLFGRLLDAARRLIGR